VADYGPDEHERGGSHAFYARTVEQGELILTSWRGIIGPSARGMSATLKYITAKAQRYAIGISHVDTGAMRAAHRMSIGRGV
jgi:hypothetical protein